MAANELEEIAKRELRCIDRRFLFWIALGVETQSGSTASAADVDWTELDWPSLRDSLDDWLDGLPSTTPEVTYRWSISESLRLCFIVKPRSADAVGYRRMPSFKLADSDPLPPLHFEDGGSEALESLSIETVRELAAGSRRLALELVSHRAAWTMLYELMSAMGKTNTSELNSIELEVHAAALGLVEGPADRLGDFDEGWRAVYGLDVPMTNDPRSDGTS